MQQTSNFALLCNTYFAPIAKTIEHEVAALNALKALRYIAPDADDFDLVESLRITKSKARSLLYQAALREEMSLEQVDRDLRNALKSTRMLRDGSLYLVEAPDPLTIDPLLEELIPDNKKAEIEQRLIEAGMVDMTLSGALKEMFGKIGKAAMNEVGEQAGKAVGEQISKVILDGWKAMKPVFDGNA